MTSEQLTALKELSDCFETGIASTAQVRQLKELLAQLNRNSQSFFFEDNDELRY